jgi:hypothetical protein
MHKRSVTAAVVFALTQSAFAADAPQVTLSVPPAFATEVTVKHYREGQDLLHDDIYHLIPIAPLTEYHGWFGPRHVRQADMHAWTVYVFAHYSSKVAAACATAKDGYEADLSIEPEFFGLNECAYMFARFERKRFSWGSAVSFLSQTVQDVALYVPHNGHLDYEVWGVTPDRRFTVVAHLSVSHPNLGNWGIKERPKVRVADSIEALKRDRDYQLVETCNAEEFEPSLTAFDRMLDTLVVQ